jgi:DNA-binding XRE family transcriptional regulator
MITKEKLQALRKELGYSQAQIAAMCKIGQPAWSALEGGTNQVSPTLTELLRVMFGLNQDWIDDKSDQMFDHNTRGDVAAISDQVAAFMVDNGITVRAASKATGIEPYEIAKIINTGRLSEEQLYVFERAYPRLVIIHPLSQDDKDVYEGRIKDLRTELDRCKKVLDKLLEVKS